MLLAVVLFWAVPARATMDSGVLAQLVKEKKLGLSDEESEQAMAVLQEDTVRVDLNKVTSAKDAASSELLQVSPDTLANPFDGSAPLSGGSFSGYAPMVPEGVAIDPKTGRPKPKRRPRGQTGFSVNGRCDAEASQAVADFKSFLQARMQDDQEDPVEGSAGPFGEFFEFVTHLFFPRPEARRFVMPAITTGKTVMERAIATYHSGEPGLLTFDCEKFPPYGAAMRRKIACHEFYHWYQDRIGGLEEPSAYAVMPHC